MVRSSLTANTMSLTVRKRTEAHSPDSKTQPIIFISLICDHKLAVWKWKILREFDTTVENKCLASLVKPDSA